MSQETFDPVQSGITSCSVALKNKNNGKCQFNKLDWFISLQANEDIESPLRNFSFNISHQGDFTVLAAQPHVAVGVDVMKTVYPSGSSTVTSFFHTMRKQFTPDEWQTIKSQEGEWKQLEIFYRHW
ncbi:PREDICTED: L-aminoadipate-semialdehyde dehydrogenase-phosphopantetheinyl transferase-like, partial [Acropora digitifera]|uniref:L-aminoadipate-semialdehyde dehydrogenase-phosphopantetheinyl transferase-like n=1 Tax=Acropora digitifera TaxID=70779 RepID=UPI00077AFDEF